MYLNWLFFRHVLAILVLCSSIWILESTYKVLDCWGTAIARYDSQPGQYEPIQIFLDRRASLELDRFIQSLNPVATLFVVTALAANSAPALGTQHTTFKEAQGSPGFFFFIANSPLFLINYLLGDFEVVRLFCCQLIPLKVLKRWVKHFRGLAGCWASQLGVYLTLSFTKWLCLGLEQTP